MRRSKGLQRLVLGFILACSVSHGLYVANRRLSADELQPAPQEGDLTDSDKDQQTDKEASKSASRFNLAIKTGGGTQLWTDHRYRNGYRVQQNALTGHWRCLDPKDVRQGWGSNKQCYEILDRVQPRPTEPVEPKHYVVLLHGLMRTHHSMKPVAAALAEKGHSEVIRFSYASTRSSIADHSAALREVLEDLPDNTEFSFVGHSMGNIVVRHMIGRFNEDDPKQVLTRCKAMVMLGPPNQGAAISRRLAPTGVYEWITGEGGMELGPKWESFVKELAIPPFPFLIIAGDLSELPVPVKNPLLEGSSDFVVGLEEARLEGAEALKTVPVLHSFLMNDPKSVEMTIDFLMEHP